MVGLLGIHKFLCRQQYSSSKKRESNLNCNKYVSKISERHSVRFHSLCYHMWISLDMAVSVTYLGIVLQITLKNPLFQLKKIL